MAANESTRERIEKMSIILDHVNYVYGADTPLAVHALNDVCLKIPDGQFIGIIGHTGSGKSTLMQHMNGLIRATDGHIYFNGEDIYDKDYDMKNRFFNRKLAGGAMLDIGVYALSIVRSFMEEKPENLMSQWKSAPTGVDEQATILLQNDKDQMATVALTMHSKQPKRVMISCEKGYIEIMEFPRADKAIITEALTGEKREISAGNTADALYYELTDMETAINSGDASVMKLQYSIDVMDIMTRLRNEWGLKYPEEE